MQINFILAEQPYIIVVRTPRRRRCGSFFSPYIRVLHYYYYYYIVAQPSGLECECANLISFPFFTSCPERKGKKTSMTMRDKPKQDSIYIYMRLESFIMISILW